MTWLKQHTCHTHHQHHPAMSRTAPSLPDADYNKY